MPDDPVIENPNPPRANHTPLVCEFCGCTVSKVTGQMVNRSAKATAMMDLDNANRLLTQKIADLETALRSAQDDLAQARERLNAPPVPKRSFRNLDDQEITQ